MFLKKLKEHNSLLFGRWFEKGGSRKQALQHEVEFTYDYIKGLFTKQGKDDAYPKISYSLGVWNGAAKDQEVVSLGVSLGGTESKYFTNNCVINLPYEGEQHEFYKDKRNREMLINFIKEHWNPEWIMVDGETSSYRNNI